MGSYFSYYEPQIIMNVNSFAPTDKQFEFIIEIFPNDDDTPSLNMYRFANNRIKYNH